MESNSSPNELVQRLFLQHAAPLRGFILGLLPDRAAADDVFQEVFLTASNRAATFDVDANFLAWARGIARFKVMEHYRRKRVSPQPFDDAVIELLVSTAGKRNDHWEERRNVLARCIQQLAPRARQILELRYAEQPLSPPAIAERLAWTVNAVNVALSRARKFLQDCTRQALVAGGLQ